MLKWEETSWSLDTCPLSYHWLAGNQGMEKKMETPIMDYVETTIKDPFLHS